MDWSCQPLCSWAKKTASLLHFLALVHMLPCAPLPCPAWSWHMTGMEPAELHTQLEFQHRAKAEPSRPGPSCSHWRPSSLCSPFPFVPPHPSLSFPSATFLVPPSSCFGGRDYTWMFFPFPFICFHFPPPKPRSSVLLCGHEPLPSPIFRKSPQANPALMAVKRHSLALQGFIKPLDEWFGVCYHVFCQT